MTPRLTIVLPLKGRPLFTLRFLWHANRVRLPYRFLIADGEVHPAMAELLENSRGVFPNLDIEYVRYPNDVNFSRYYAKMYDAVRRVRTPYMMFVDNDDFLAHAGIERNIDFLESHPDYVCCGGGIAGFSVHAPLRDPLGVVVGPFSKIARNYVPHDRPADFNSASVTERLIAGLCNEWSYYAVFRSPAQVAICEEIVQLDLSDLQLHEKFCAMRTLTLGKTRSDPSVISYWRQYWTSLRSSYSQDWVHHLLRSRFTSDFANIVDRISCVAAAVDGGDQAAIAEKLRACCEPWLRHQIRINYGGWASVRKILRTYVPWFVIWLKKRRRLSIIFERRAVLGKLRRDGATPEYLARFKAELAQIEEVLTGSEFRNFVKSTQSVGAGEQPRDRATRLSQGNGSLRCG